MSEENIMFVLAAIGLLTVALLLVWLAYTIEKAVKRHLLIRQFHSDSANQNRDAIKDLTGRVEFLEREERERTKAENEARKATKQ